jgi:hypothetical protein
MAGYSNSDVVRVFVDDLLASTEDLEKITIMLDASAEDADNEDPLVLRKGLVLVKDGDTYVQYSGVADTEQSAVVLEYEVHMDGVNQRLASVFFQATFNEAALVLADAVAGDFEWEKVQRLRKR